MKPNQILCGDALTTLKTLPSESVQCIVTSPPYYALRDYGVDGQIGLEETPAAFVAKLVEVFREARRVLRSDGTLWLNMGDSYATGGQRQTGRRDDGNAECSTSRLGEKQQGFPGNSGMGKRTNLRIGPTGFKPKDLMMIPARLAIALQDDGWWLRSDIIWHKINAMPESATDRPTSAHEHLFLLAKSERYFYDNEAIREPGAEWKGQAGTFARATGKATLLTIPGQTSASHRDDRDDRVPNGRNKRNVWPIASQPYSEAHFATMPQKLVEPCILAGSPPGGVVLDPFMGAGTVALVSIRLQRQYLGIELNPEYVRLIEKRIAEVQPTLWAGGVA